MFSVVLGFVGKDSVPVSKNQWPAGPIPDPGGGKRTGNGSEYLGIYNVIRVMKSLLIYLSFCRVVFFLISVSSEISDRPAHVKFRLISA